MTLCPQFDQKRAKFAQICANCRALAVNTSNCAIKSRHFLHILAKIRHFCEKFTTNSQFIHACLAYIAHPIEITRQNAKNPQKMTPRWRYAIHVSTTTPPTYLTKMSSLMSKSVSTAATNATKSPASNGKLFISRVGPDVSHNDIKWVFEEDLKVGKVKTVNTTPQTDKNGAGYQRVYVQIYWYANKKDCAFRKVITTKEYTYKYYPENSETYEKWPIMTQTEKPATVEQKPRKSTKDLEVDPNVELDLFIMRVSNHIKTAEVAEFFSQYGKVKSVNAKQKTDKNGKPYRHMFVAFDGWNKTQESIDLWNQVHTNGQCDLTDCIYDGERWSIRELVKRDPVERQPQSDAQAEKSKSAKKRESRREAPPREPLENLVPVCAPSDKAWSNPSEATYVPDVVEPKDDIDQFLEETNV